MADIITRLKLESGEYDSKLKRATQGLLQMEQECRNVGGTLAILEKDQLDYVKSLGQMDTVSNSVRGKLAELTNAYTELSVQYKRLTDEEKEGDFGKALSESLAQLKDRIGETKGQLRSVGNELGSSGSAFDKLTSKLTVNIDAVKLFNVGMKAAEGALNVAKDAFFASEATVDEWGRTMQSAQSVYEGFLNSINNGDISGYLSNINDIVQAARKAYDEMDLLGTMKTIQSPQIDKQNAENIRLRTMLMTGKYIAPAKGSGMKAAMATGTQLTPDQLRKIETMLQNGMKTIVSLTDNELKQTGKAIDAYYESLAKQNGMSLQEFKKGTSSWEEFNKRLEGAKNYSQWREEHSTTDVQGYRHYEQGNPYEEFKKWSVFRVDKIGENSYNELVGLVKQQTQQSSQMYSTIGQAYRTINRVEGTTVRNIMSGGKSGGVGGSNKIDTSKPIVINAPGIADLAKVKDKGADTLFFSDRDKGGERRMYDLGNLTQYQKDWQKEKEGYTGRQWDEVFKGKRDVQTERDIFRGVPEKDFKSKEKDKEEKKKNDKFIEGLNKATTVMSGVNQTLTGIQQIGIEIPKELQNAIGFVQGLMSVIQGVSTVISVFSTGTLAANTLETDLNTVALLALTKVMAANTATNLLPLSTGGIPMAANGIIAGQSYKSDRLAIAVNSGEMVISESDQKRLFDAIKGDSLSVGFGGLKAVIRGEDIHIVSSNYRRRARA